MTPPASATLSAPPRNTTAMIAFGSSRAPRVGVVHHRREEIDRFHDRHVGTDPVHGRVVGAPQPDEQVGVMTVGSGLDDGEHLLEISRSHLGSSAGAGGVRGEPDFLAARRRVGHDVPYDASEGAFDSTKSTKAWASGERVRSRLVTR